MNGVLTRRSFPSIEIQRSRPRLGPAVGNSHAGSLHSFDPAKSSTISEFNRRLFVRGAQRGGEPLALTDE